MESVSSMKSVGTMNFYEDDCGVPAYMAVRNSVTKSELGKEHLELESNQLEDHINDIHDCQQDPDNFEVNGVCIGQEEEEEEDEGNACKVDEGGTTVCGIADVRNDENGEITAKTGVHVQTQQTSVDVKCAKQDGGNSSKSMTKIWSDIPSNEDRDGIAKIEGVPEQAQGTTGSGVPGGVIRISNLKKGKGIADVPNDEDGEITAKTGVHVQTQQTSDDVRPAKIDRGNSSKINEESMTKTWSDIPSNEDRNGIAKIEGVPEQAQGTTGPDDVRLAKIDRGNSSKINEESMTKTWCDIPSNEDRDGIAKIEGVPEQTQGTTGSGIADIQIDEDEKTAAKTEVNEQTQPTSDDVRLAKIDRGNSSKINEESMTKMWSDIPSNEDRDKIAKIEGVPEQAQGTTGPVCNDIPQKQQDAHINGLTSSNNTRNRKESVNAKQAGEEVEKGGRNTPKMEEDFKTRTECEDSDDVNTPKVNGATENSKEERQDGVNTSDVNAKQAGEEVEKGGGNTPKMEEDFNTSTDAVKTPEMDSTTENSKEEGQNGGNIPTVNDKQAGEEVEKEGGNHPKMEEDLKTRTECEDSDDVNTPKVNGATENSKEERQDEMNSSDVNAKQAGEEVEKGGGNTPKMEEDFNTSTVENAKQTGEKVERRGGDTQKMEEDLKTSTEFDNKEAVNTPEMESTTEDSKEEGQNGGNIPTDYNGECDSKQDADNSPSWLNGTIIWQFLFFGFFLILLYISTQITCIPSACGTPASNPHKYAADPQSTQKYFNCDHFSTLFINASRIFDSKSSCYCESMKKKCLSGFERFCLPLVTEKRFIAGCINITGLHLLGEKCLLVTIVDEHKKYHAECHDKKCPICTNANSLEERLKMCLFQKETSGDSHSNECTPKKGSATSGRVQPTYWILCLCIAFVLLIVLTSD